MKLFSEVIANAVFATARIVFFVIWICTLALIAWAAVFTIGSQL